MNKQTKQHIRGGAVTAVWITTVQNTQRHNCTNPARPWPKPPTPPQFKHRHMSHNFPVPTRLVKPKHNPVAYTPPPQAKDIHISRTTLISSTSSTLDTTPEPQFELGLSHLCYSFCRFLLIFLIRNRFLSK